MLFQKAIQKSLEKHVRGYLAKNPGVKTIVVTGSFGKTSTKEAIATLLSQRYRVRMENKRPENVMSVPLGILGIEYPDKPTSLMAWLAVLRAAKRRQKLPSDVDVVIQELICTQPGDIAQLASYLKPSITVITGVAPINIDAFGNVEAIAGEFLSIANASEWVLINRDDVEGRFASMLTNQNIDTYGTTDAAEYKLLIDDFDLANDYTCTFAAPQVPEGVSVKLHVVGEHSLRPRVAAAAIAINYGLSKEAIATGLELSRPEKGRMNKLRGLDESIIIDDSYGSNPTSMEAALRTLYGCDTPARIALIGDMNGLGPYTESEHQKIGDLCDPNLLVWVVTVGKASSEYLAPRARARGCQVKTFQNTLEAGGFVHKVLENRAVVLASGSGEGVYLEEALKIVLHATEENNELVRQSPTWMETKEKFFVSFEK